MAIPVTYDGGQDCICFCEGGGQSQEDDQWQSLKQ